MRTDPKEPKVVQIVKALAPTIKDLLSIFFKK